MKERVPKYEIVAPIAGGLVVAIGALVLAGWVLGIETLKSIVPGFVSMKPNTALCFIASGVALWLLRGGRRGVTRLWLVRACAFLVAITGALNLLEDAVRADLRIDQWLFRDVLPASSAAAPGRMAPTTALCFILGSASLLLAATRRRRVLAQWPALAIGVTSFLALIGFGYGANEPYRFAAASSIALNTTVAFVALGVGLLFLHPSSGPVATVTDDHLGGVLARRLLPVAILLPVMLGWLCVAGQEANWFGPEMGTAALASAVIVSFAGLIWATARSMSAADAQRRRAEGALRESESRFRSYVEQAPLGIFVTDEAGRYVDANLAATQMLGYDLGALLGKSVAELVADEDRERALRGFASLAAGETVDDEHRLKASDGRLVWVSLRAVAIGGNRFMAFCRDITERKRAESERELLATAIYQAAEAIIVTDAQGTIQYVNPAFGNVTGYAPSEAIGQNPRFLKSGEQDATFYERLWGTIAGGKTWEGRLVNKKKDGTLYTEEATISPVRNAAGAIVHYVAVKRDISHELALEAQLLQSHRMESVGRLAGGVAHEFNNMLQVILAHTAMALSEVPPQGDLYEGLEEVRKAAQRSADLTRQLLAFAQRQTVVPKVLDLNDAIAGALKMLGRLVGEDVALAWVPGGALWQTKVDPAQVDQILANLCVNARDAIGGPGRVTIETHNATLDEAFCAGHAGSVPGEYVMLALSDDGSGMPKEVLEHLFEPFFTTKEVGQGTGLGLATVYGIVKQNDGAITVDSEPGQGTAFRVYLPRFVGKTATAQPGTAAEAPKGHGETVLLVEDEPAILRLGKRILERLGYDVLAAGSGAEAIRQADAHGGAIRLLVTDVMMPEMNGRELADRLRAADPNLRCLYMSGYTADAIAQPGGVLDSDVLFLRKPFTIEDMAEKVREALSSTKRS